MQTSAEYQAVARQTYAAGRIALDRALADSRWTAALEQDPDLTGSFDNKPPAVILDLDETVLDNSPLQARNVARGQTFTSERWQSWVGEKKAGLVPGAREFLAYAHARVSCRSTSRTGSVNPTAMMIRRWRLCGCNNFLLHPDVCYVAGKAETSQRDGEA